MDQQPVKIGKITRSMEETLKLSLAHDVSIYLAEEKIRQFAEAHPDSYLRIVEEIRSVVRTPDLLCFREDDRSLLFVRVYWLRGDFRAFRVLIQEQGTPKKWCVLGFGEVEDEEKENATFRRVRISKASSSDTGRSKGGKRKS